MRWWTCWCSTPKPEPNQKKSGYEFRSRFLFVQRVLNEIIRRVKYIKIILNVNISRLCRKIPHHKAAGRICILDFIKQIGYT